jgi:hypothetical protein
MRSAEYIQESNFASKRQVNIDISTTEIEISLKQMFKAKLLSLKIGDKLTPIK